MPVVHQNAGRNGFDQGVVHAVNLLRIGVAPGERGIKYPYREQEESVLKPFHIVGHRCLGDLVPQRLEVPGQGINRVKRCCVIQQSVRKIGERARVGDIVPLNEVAEQNGGQVFLMDSYSQVPADVQHFRKSAGLPVLLKRLLHQQKASGGHRLIGHDAAVL